MPPVLPPLPLPTRPPCQPSGHHAHDHDHDHDHDDDEDDEDGDFLDMLCKSLAAWTRDGRGEHSMFVCAGAFIVLLLLVTLAVLVEGFFRRPVPERVIVALPPLTGDGRGVAVGETLKIPLLSKGGKVVKA